MSIPVELAVPDPEAQARVIYDVKDLADSIREHGQLEPVLAYEKGGKYYVYIGMRRLFAIGELYKVYGEPKTIKAEITPEPDPETKKRIILEENSEHIRKNLNLYDKMWLVWQRHPLVNEMIKLGIIKPWFVKSASPLRLKITVDELRRWYQIEMLTAGEQRLGLEHIVRVSDLEKEERDYAIYALVSTGTPAGAISDIKGWLGSVLVDETRMAKLGIKKPKSNGDDKIESPAGSKGAAASRPSKPASKTGAKETSDEEDEASNEKTESVPVHLLPRSEFASFLERSGFVIVYADREPEVRKVMVSDGEIVEIDGKKHRFNLV
ncbi:MAG: ParB N-terminal domain-containing protein [Nitrososphaerota archaeon]|jgi:hypothetical protein|nr:ParB N-terminal domain-containing protein [Nitrososphaerota archaeon]MDG6944882.1 ParB N-terminal domain-containing protein [Nitrososphaerota archaeon]